MALMACWKCEGQVSTTASACPHCGAFLSKGTPKEAAAAADKHRAEKIFAASPAGRARAAKAGGATIFQVDIPLSKTMGYISVMIGAFTDTSDTTDFSHTIQAIEKEGWHLEHVGYVYRVTGSVSRDKFLASGQQESEDEVARGSARHFKPSATRAIVSHRMPAALGVRRRGSADDGHRVHAPSMRGPAQSGDANIDCDRADTKARRVAGLSVALG